MNDRLPKGWKLIDLNQLFDFKNGINADKECYGQGTKFVNLMEVISNNTLYYEDIPGTVEIDSAKRDLYSVKKGDVLFNRTSETRNELGLSAVYMDAHDVVFGGFIIRARPKNGALDPNFCKYCFLSDSVRKEIVRKGQGAIRANIGQKDLGEVVLTLPPISEQKKIADILSSWDKAIEYLEILMVKKTKVKEYYSHCVLNNQFEYFGIENIVSRKVGSFSKTFAGGTPSTKEKEFWSDGNIPWMSSGEVNNGKIYEVSKRITSKGLKSSAAKWVPIDSILVALAGQGKTRGKVAINKIELTTNQSLAAIVPDNTIDAGYLYRYLDTQYKNLRRLSDVGGGRGGLNLRIINDFSVKHPKRLVDQKKHNKLFDLIDTEIETLSDQKKCLLKQKRGLLQQLLVGKRRVKT